MSARRGDVPSLGVLVTGGIGVLVVVAFVGAIALGRQSRTGPGDRLAVVAGGEPVGLQVVAARCPDERVRAVEVRVPDGAALWRIESERGTIDRSFVVGGEPPTFFETVTALHPPLPPGELEAEVVIDDIVDERQFDPSAVDDPALLAVPCADSDLGLLPLVFIAGALGVVVAYGAMVARFWRTP